MWPSRLITETGSLLVRAQIIAECSPHRAGIFQPVLDRAGRGNRQIFVLMPPRVCVCVKAWHCTPHPHPPTNLGLFSSRFLMAVLVAFSYSSNTKPFTNKPQGDSLPILKTNLNHFLQSMSGSETRIPALLLTQLLCLCHHFTAKRLWPFSLQNSGNGKGKGRFLSEKLHLCSASHLLACMHWAVAEQVALQTTSHLALTFSYQSHLIKGVNSSIGSAQLVCTC